MIKINPCRHTVNKVFIFFILALGVSQVSAIDCSTVKIDYTDNPEWSRDERIKAMDKAFFESISRFEQCNLSNQSNAASSSANEMGTSSEAMDGEGSESGSTKKSEMTGTEPESGTESSDGSSNNPSPSENSTHKPAEKNTASGTKSGGNPKDIPSANNDDVMAAQIRLAAEIEQDPAKKKKLWNEYRKYKGLPTQ